MISPFIRFGLRPSMNDRPIIIHSLEDAKAALAIAAELGVPVTLRSAPGAGRYLGASVFRDMVDVAAGSAPPVTVTTIFDCGDDPGLALGALRLGLKVIRTSITGDAKDRIAEIAAQTGARLDEDISMPVLDLLPTKNKEAALRSWLSQGKQNADK